MNDEFDLFRSVQPPRAEVKGDDDPDGPEARAIMAELRRKPQSVDHIADELGYPLDQTRRVFRALVQAGHVVDVQERIKTKTYDYSIVWHPTKP